MMLASRPLSLGALPIRQGGGASHVERSWAACRKVPLSGADRGTAEQVKAGNNLPPIIVQPRVLSRLRGTRILNLLGRPKLCNCRSNHIFIDPMPAQAPGQVVEPGLAVDLLQIPA